MLIAASPLEAAVSRLAKCTAWSYGPQRTSVAEPAAWAALALLGHGRVDDALPPALWLAELQQSNGSVGISADLDEPRWCTSLAMLAWAAVDSANRQQRFAEPLANSARWALAERGKTNPRDSRIGHDTTLAGWSWAADTHSWLEPTCFFVMGLRAAGFATHPRVREGVRLVADRLLPAGGANYGNTMVLGQTLVPHLQPSGIAMLTLAGETAASDKRVAASLDYLAANAKAATTPASLAFALLGLTAHGRRPGDADRRLARAIQFEGGPASPDASAVLPPSTYELALTLLAAEPAASWFAEFLVEPLLPLRQEANS
ncbi:MAG: hypothetical protein KDA44_02165 [Planctomycetales bacterium]|nr:hypothetical protein [Planctomycetales bacterium]